MGSEPTRADVWIYFTGSPTRADEPSLPNLQAIEAIELFKFFGKQLAEEHHKALVALIDRMCELPSYNFAKNAARHFGRTGLFARIKFTYYLHGMAEKGFGLINPTGGVFGLDPDVLFKLGLLDEFLGKDTTRSSEEIWAWVRKEIRTLEKTQKELKAAGINPWQ